MRVNYGISEKCLAMFECSEEQEERVEKEYNAARSALNSDYKKVWDAVVSGTCTYAAVKHGRRGFRIWTRSTRPGVVVQITSVAILEKTRTDQRLCLVALCHHDCRSFDDTDEYQEDETTIFVRLTFRRSCVGFPTALLTDCSAVTTNQMLKSVRFLTSTYF